MGDKASVDLNLLGNEAPFSNVSSTHNRLLSHIEDR
jgi:hypothetical protein